MADETVMRVSSVLTCHKKNLHLPEVSKSSFVFLTKHVEDKIIKSAVRLSVDMMGFHWSNLCYRCLLHNNLPPLGKHGSFICLDKSILRPINISLWL